MIKKVIFSTLIFMCFISTYSQTTYTCTPAGTGSLQTLTSWTNSVGTHPASFTVANCTYIINTSTATTSGAWTVSGTGSKIQVGDGASATNFTIPTTTADKVIGTVNVMNSATLTLGNATIPTLGTLSVGSTVIYAGSAATQNVINATYYNLTLAGPGATKKIDTTISGANTTITNILNINSGVAFNLNPNLDTTIINGTITGAGTITGGTNANLSIGGTGSFGTIIPSTGTLTLNNLTLNRGGLGSVTLGGNVTLQAGNFLNGVLVLNGQTLTIQGAFSFPASSANGTITGDAAANLSITATTLTNSLFMTSGAQILNNLTLSTLGQTLTLGNDLTVSGAYKQTKGIVNINGHTLSLTGTATFASTAANGTTSGSASSNLLISVTTLANDFFMTPGFQKLNNFTLNSPGKTFTLGAGDTVTISGTYSQTNGIVKLNGQSLILNGPVVFPAASTNGTITGSTTSNLTIATSSLTNSLFLTGTGQSFNNFTLNSLGQTLTLGTSNNLTVDGAFTQTKGNINLNGNTLTLSGTASFSTSYSNGYITGSSVAILSITATSISNSLFMNQTTAGITNVFKKVTLNSAGQTLTLGNDLVIVSGGTYTHTNGIVNLNGHKLTLDGTVVFPAAISNGSYTGSSASAINIGGSGNITNDLFMTQTSSATSSLSNLIMDRSSKTLTLGNALNIIDSISPTLGTLNIGSNLTLIADLVNVGHTGRISKVSGTLTSTSITSQVYHNPPPGNTTNWMLMGCGGVSNATFAQWNNSFQITCPSGCSSTGPGGPFTSLTTYAESTDTYPAITGTASTIVPGLGYWVYLGTTSPGTNSGAELITVSGTPKTGTFTWPTLTNTSGGPGIATGDNGYNLISNPYPSAISWNKVIHDPLNASAVASFPNLANMYMYSPIIGDYVSYNATSGISNPSSYAPGTTTVRDKIPTGGAFYVVVGPSTGSATLKISEGDKVMSGSDSSFLFRQANPNTIQSTSSSATPYFSLVASNGTNSSEASVAFNSNATLGNDVYDTPALPWNSILQITTAAQGKNYSVNALPGFSQNYSLPVKIISGTTVQFAITPMYLQNIPEGACLNLHDNYTNTDYDLRQGAFNVTINDTETVARFVLNITIDNSLVVTSNFQNPTCANSANGLMIAVPSGSGSWNYYWKDASNNIIKTSLNKNTADTLYNANAGNYHVDINTSGLCNNGTPTFTLQGTNSPNALYTTPSTTVVLNNDTANVVFTNGSTNANTYIWDFGDGNQATSTDIAHQYTDAGVYVVTLTAYNQACGETSVYSQVITVDSTSSSAGIKTFASNENNMQISKDAAGYYVQFNYNIKTNAVISVQNLLGEKVVADINQENVLNNKAYIPLGNTENNILIISVITSSGEKTFRKIVNY